jgi:glycosyltransferase involved in cell wall biosynthesis
MKKDLCLVVNVAALYRRPIFKMIDAEFCCDFYIGDKVGYPLELMDYNDLIGFKKKLPFRKIFNNFYWLGGSVSVVVEPYKIFILTGEPHCISTWIFLVLAKILRKKTILWSHGWYGGENRIKRFIKKLFFSLASKVMLYGDRARNLMIKEGFDQDNLFCIYNSLDYNHQVIIRRTLNYTSIYKSYFGNSNPVIIFIGRLTKIKKLNQLIHCLNLLHSKNVSCNLVLIGNGEEENMLSELVSMYKLNNKVWFYGSCFKEEELANLIYNANVCVSPGNVGLTAIHCFTYGVPVITHNNFNKQVPEFEAIVPNVNGNFFKEDSIQDMCEKIIPWLKSTESQKNTIKRQCYTVVDKKYNPNNQINILKENLTF